MNEYPPQDNQPTQEPQQPFNQPPQQPYPQQQYPPQQNFPSQPGLPPYPNYPPQQQPPTQYPPNYPPGYQPPYPPYTPPPPPPAKKKRGPLFWVLLVLGIVLVIGLCSAVMNAASHLSSNATTAAQSTPTTIPTLSTTAQAILTQAASGNTNATPTPAPNTVSKVGGTITLNGVDATLTKVTVGPVDQYSTPKPGYEFVTVHIKLRNTSGVEQTYNQLAFHVKSGTGNITDVDAATYGTGINDLGYGTLSTGGGTAEGNIVFQVKQGDHKVMLTWQPNQFTDSAGDNGWSLGL